MSKLLIILDLIRTKYYVVMTDSRLYANTPKDSLWHQAMIDAVKPFKAVEEKRAKSKGGKNA